MTVLPTERPAPAPAPAAVEVESHPRLDRRRQRRRQRIEGFLVILVLPVAVALTLFMLLTASGGSVLPATQASARPVAHVEGSLPTPLAARVAAEGVDLQQSPAPAARERSEVLYFDAEDRHLAEDVQESLRAGVVVFGSDRPEGARIVIRVGKDLAQ